MTRKEETNIKANRVNKSYESNWLTDTQQKERIAQLQAALLEKGGER